MQAPKGRMLSVGDISNIRVKRALSKHATYKEILKRVCDKILWVVRRFPEATSATYEISPLQTGLQNLTQVVNTASACKYVTDKLEKRGFSVEHESMGALVKLTITWKCDRYRRQKEKRMHAVQFKDRNDAQGLLQEYLVDPIVELFDDMYNDVVRRDNRLMVFQRKLKDVPLWKDDQQLAICMNVLNDKCSFLNELITAMYLYHIKSISAIQNNSINNFKIQLPNKSTFVHNIMTAMAKHFYENPFIFRNNDTAAKRATARKSIDTYIVRSLPVKEILDAYIGGTCVESKEENIIMLNTDPNNAIMQEVKNEISNLGNNLSMMNNNGNNRDQRGMNMTQSPDGNGDHTEAVTESDATQTASHATSIQPTATETAQATATAMADTLAANMNKEVYEPEFKTILDSDKTTETIVQASMSLLPKVKATASVGGVTTAGKKKTPEPVTLESEKDVKVVDSAPTKSEASSRKGKANAGGSIKASPAKKGSNKQPGGGSNTSELVATNTLSKKQQRELLDEILKFTRTKEMVTPSFFSDAESETDKGKR